jgi:hypothetical protein
VAVKKVEEVKEEMEEVVLEEEGFKEVEDGLKTVAPPEIEVVEGEAETEEIPEEKKVDPTASAMLEGFNMLREELRNKNDIPVRAQSSEEETEETFGKKVNEDIFKDDPYGIISKAIDRRARKIVESEVGPILGSIMETAMENAEFRLRNDAKDGGIYEKFEPEVKRILKTLSPAQQKNPQVLKAVFDKVKSDHVDEIIEIRIAERSKEKKSSLPGKRPVSEGASTVMPSSSSSGTRVMIPKKEMEELRAKAGRLGMDVKELIARRGK